MLFNVLFPGYKQQSAGGFHLNFTLFTCYLYLFSSRSIVVLCYPALRISQDIWENRKKKEDRQYTYNVTLMRFRITTVAVEKHHQIFWMCFCTLDSVFRNGKSHLFCVALYCHLRPVWLYHIFPTLSYKSNEFQKNIYIYMSLNMKCV